MRISNEFRNFLIIPTLAIAHFFYHVGVGYALYDIIGGIQTSDSGWTQLGGTDWAFGIPLFAPACQVLADTNVGPCSWEGGPWDVILLFGAWLLVAIASGQLIQKVVNKEPNKYGRFYWRLLVVILGWAFVPVPVEMTFVYGFTVLC